MINGALNVSVQAEASPAHPLIWDRDLPPAVIQALETLFHEYKTTTAPNLRLTSNIVQIALALHQNLVANAPPSHYDAAKTVTNYIIDWITDYATQTGNRFLQFELSFSGLGAHQS